MIGGDRSEGDVTGPNHIILFGPIHGAGEYYPRCITRSLQSSISSSANAVRRAGC